MLEIICYKCKNELDDQGALIFGAPVTMQVMKWHICQTCFVHIWDWLYGEDL